jgi:hypothetical protein
MTYRTVLLGFAAVGLLSTHAVAQQATIREQLVARGAPEAFADQVAGIVAQARADGLPTAPLASKALEGWAKRNRVPPERVVTALQGLSGRLGEGRVATVAAGLDPPPGPVVAAAAEALGRGMTSEDVRSVIQGAPTPDEAATGLTVASALAAQGLENRAAVMAIRNAHQRGRPSREVLELPSALADLLKRGVPMSEVARRIHEGGGLPLGAQAGGQGSRRPDHVPPGQAKKPIKP